MRSRKPQGIYYWMSIANGSAISYLSGGWTVFNLAFSSKTGARDNESLCHREKNIGHVHHEIVSARYHLPQNLGMEKSYHTGWQYTIQHQVRCSGCSGQRQGGALSALVMSSQTYWRADHYCCLQCLLQIPTLQLHRVAWRLFYLCQRTHYTLTSSRTWDLGLGLVDC